MPKKTFFVYKLNRILPLTGLQAQLRWLRLSPYMVAVFRLSSNYYN